MAICPFIYFVIFGWMDSMPLKKFDEVRLAINAIEMSMNHNWFITFFEGQPDLWNTKPPLLIWIQCLFIKLFGINEIAIRLPSALAALATCFILYRFIIKEFKNKWIAIFSVLILITTNGYVNKHGARSGDYDTLVCLFLLIQAISFYNYIQTKDIKYIVYFSLGIVFGCMTKSITGLLFLPGFLIYILLEKKFNFIYDWKLILGFIISISIVLSFYFYRESLSSGYLKAVFENELGGRYMKSIEGHHHEWWFYLKLFFNEKFIPWYFILFIGLIINKIKENFSRFIRFVFTIVFSYIIILSSAQTKISWYDMPIFPLLAIITAIGFYNIYTLINENKKIYAIFFIVFIFSAAYIPMILNSYKPLVSNGEIEDYRLCYFIKNHSSIIAKYKKINFIYNGYQPQNKFYEYYLKDKFPTIEITSKIEKGVVVFFSDEEAKNNINLNYKVEVLGFIDYTYSYLIL